MHDVVKLRPAEAPRPAGPYSTGDRDRLIRLPECERLTSIRKSMIYALMAKEPPEFPRSIRLAKRCVVWSEAAVLRWVHERINAQPGSTS